MVMKALLTKVPLYWSSRYAKICLLLFTLSSTCPLTLDFFPQASCNKVCFGLAMGFDRLLAKATSVHSLSPPLVTDTQSIMLSRDAVLLQRGTQLSLSGSFRCFDSIQTVPLK